MKGLEGTGILLTLALGIASSKRHNSQSMIMTRKNGNKTPQPIDNPIESHSFVNACLPMAEARAHGYTRAFFLWMLVFAGGCASPTVHSLDSRANYGYVFGNVSAPEPAIIHSHIERPHRSVLGIVPLHSKYNGNWEFELVVSSAWLEQVKAGFTEVTFSDTRSRQVPSWFVPSPDRFTEWKMQATSYPNAHLFIDKTPPSPEQIRVFICRH